ncbi:hypothetical protein Hanom_Chr02g00133651 [Helianthus anomalus]
MKDVDEVTVLELWRKMMKKKRENWMSDIGFVCRTKVKMVELKSVFNKSGCGCGWI